MKTLGVILSLVLVLAVSISAQQMLLNASYLGQFPSVEKVKVTMKVADEVDSYARYVAALEVINDFMVHDLLQAPNGGMYNMPPAADRVHDQYRIAITKNIIDSPEPPSKDPRYRTLRDKYEKDPVFADMLLQTFFTPKFRTDYYAWTRKPMPSGAVAIKGTGGAGGGTSASNDPSIAKAKAAKVDLGLFANTIRIGEPLLLPRCPYTTNFVGLPQLGEITQDCEDDPPPMSGATADAVNGVASLLVGIMGASSTGGKTAPGPDPNVHRIILLEDHCLSWMDSNRAAVHLSANGTIDRVVILTKGRTMQARVTEDLIAKYGKARISEEGTVSPAQGNTVKLTNGDWVLPGLMVEYKVLAIDENGNVQLDGQGYVRIETETAYDARVAAEKKSKEKKRVL